MYLHISLFSFCTNFPGRAVENTKIQFSTSYFKTSYEHIRFHLYNHVDAIFLKDMNIFLILSMVRNFEALALMLKKLDHFHFQCFIFIPSKKHRRLCKMLQTVNYQKFFVQVIIEMFFSVIMTT